MSTTNKKREANTSKMSNRSSYIWYFKKIITFHSCQILSVLNFQTFMLSKAAHPNFFINYFFVEVLLNNESTWSKIFLNPIHKRNQGCTCLYGQLKRGQ